MFVVGALPDGVGKRFAEVKTLMFVVGALPDVVGRCVAEVTTLIASVNDCRSSSSLLPIISPSTSSLNFVLWVLRKFVGRL